MAMQADEIAKELTVALIDRMPDNKFTDPESASKWVGDAYKTVFKAVVEGYKQKTA